ncbi:hypothetical protein NL676_024622 [Syzygium grande]|nr:hypothetical protein NL676_024622 [Syzygium grande]
MPAPPLQRLADRHCSPHHTSSPSESSAASMSMQLITTTSPASHGHSPVAAPSLEQLSHQRAPSGPYKL